jgi:hypothetical protein
MPNLADMAENGLSASRTSNATKISICDYDLNSGICGAFPKTVHSISKAGSGNSRAENHATTRYEGQRAEQIDYNMQSSSVFAMTDSVCPSPLS